MTDRLAPGVRPFLAGEIAAAGGREVSFLAQVDRDGVITVARVMARGTVDLVLALPAAAARGEMLLHNHPSGRLEPSSADLDIAVRLHDAGVGFGIIDNAATEVYVVVEVPRSRPVVRIDPFDVIEMLGEGGPVAGELGQYEDRRSQRDMAAYIADGYNDGGVLLLEAGTGVGKSFAYLVPALEWARANGERTVVSTNTINLQEQLVGKDLPLLRRALSSDDYVPTFALLKGWRNYLCLSRLHQAVGGAAHALRAGKARRAGGHRGVVGPHRRRHAERPDRRADRRGVGRGECGGRSVHPAQVLALRSLLSVPRSSPRRRGRRRGGQPPSPRGRPLRSPGAGQLGGSRGASAVSAAGARRGAPSGRCRGEPPRHPGDSRAVRRLLSRFERNGRGLRPTLVSELAGRGDLLSRASLDLIRDRLLPAIADARRASDALFVRLYERIDNLPAGQLRLSDDFAHDEIWAEGLGVRARRHPRRVSHDLRGGGDHRRPAGGVGGVGAAGADSAGAARGDPPPRSRVRRPQSDAAPGGRGTADGAVDGADDQRQPRGASRRAARPGAHPPRAAVRSSRHHRHHQRHARRGRRVRFPRVARRPVGRGLAGDGQRDPAVAVRLPLAMSLRDSRRPARSARGRARPRHRGGAGGERPGLCLGRGHVRPLHQPCVAQARGAGAPRHPRRPVADSGAGRSRPGTFCCGGFAKRRTRFCWGRTRSGRGSTCPDGRSAPSF